MPLLRALGITVVFTSLAAAQTPADRVSPAANRDLLRGERPRVAAQTPAEKASRDLNQGVRGDRFRDAASEARGDARPTRPEVQQFEPQRRSLQPDVGRPEQDGRLPSGSAAGTLPSMGPNPQR